MFEGWSQSGRIRLLILAALAVCVVALSACGSSSSSSSSSSTSGGTGSSEAEGGSSESEGEWASGPLGQEVEATVKKLYAGNYDPPPKSGPPAQEGKNVWLISCGQEYEACAQMSEAFKEAGSKLGWNVTIQDSKASQETTGTLIKQGVAANVDGIVTITSDCPNIKSALESAKSAGIPVVNFGGLDCDYEGFGGGEPLFTKTVYSRGKTFLNYGEEYARNRADVLVQHLGGEGEILSLEEQSQVAQQVFNASFKEEVAEKCPDCTVVPVPFSFAEVPTKAAQVWQAAIQSHPNAVAMSNPIDALMALGLTSTLKGAGREIWLMGAEGAPPNLQLIEEGVQGAALDVSGYAWQMWGAADTLNRVFAGSNEFPNEGGGWILVDKTHNLPPAGQAVEPTVDYRAAFESIWGGK